jgi:hypothetical protein
VARRLSCVDRVLNACVLACNYRVHRNRQHWILFSTCQLLGISTASSALFIAFCRSMGRPSCTTRRPATSWSCAKALTVCCKIWEDRIQANALTQREHIQATRTFLCHI